MVVLWRRSQSFDVNRFTLYSENIWNTTTDTDDANGAPLADPSRPAPPAHNTDTRCTDRSNAREPSYTTQLRLRQRGSHHGNNHEGVEEPLLPAKLNRHLPVLLLLGHLVVVLPALAQLDGTQRRGSGHDLFDQLAGHAHPHVRVRPHPGQSRTQAPSCARHLGDRRTRRAASCSSCTRR